MNIFDINTRNEQKDTINIIKDCFRNYFPKSLEGEVCIVSNLPAITNNLGYIEYFICIHIPYIKDKRNYHRVEVAPGRYVFLNNLVIAVRTNILDNLYSISDDELHTAEGSLNYVKNIENETSDLRKAILKFTEIKMTCASFTWVKARFFASSFEDDYIIVNKYIDVKKLIASSCRRTRIGNKVGSNLGDNFQTNSFLNKFIESCNESTKFGVVTKKKINSLTRRKSKNLENAITEEVKLSIVYGKAGSGKTYFLNQLLYDQVSKGKHVRLLTYNHLLVNDIKQTLRQVKQVNSNNASIRTLHKFFYDIAKSLGILFLLSESRADELIKTASYKISRLRKHLEKQDLDLSDLNKIKNSEEIKEKILATYKKENLAYDQKEIIEFSNFIYFNQPENLDTAIQQYLEKKKNMLYSYVGRQIFLQDYNNILEQMYRMRESSMEFYEEYKIKDRLAFWQHMNNVKKNEDVNKEISFDRFVSHVDSVTRKARWSNMILVDEGQDCLENEKLLLLSLVKGHNNLVVATGGKDQLIRYPKECLWNVSMGTRIPYNEIKLGAKSHRQKSNLSDFINNFTSFHLLGTYKEKVSSDEEMRDMGTVIIDLRPERDLINSEILENLKSSGAINGCSSYESLLFLLPHNGYTSRQTFNDLFVDTEDNAYEVSSSFNRKLDISKVNIKVWEGISEDKAKLDLPTQDEVRFIHFDSCRGLEAWSVICIDLDEFFNEKINSRDAEYYATKNADLFRSDDDLKKEFALLWCLMAFTRPMDTLYIKIKDKNSPFVKELLTVAKSCKSGSVHILS